MPRQHHPDVFRIRPLRCAIAVSLALSSLTAIAQGNAPTSIAAEAAARSWNLPAAPLADTLAHIARDSGQRLSADPALVAGKTSAPVRGNFSTTDAARQALIGTGLELVVTESGTLSVRPVPPLESNASAMLAPVTVRADTARESAWGPVQGYVAKRSATGTKTDTPIIETPQSISVVTRDQMDAQNAQSVNEALRYTAGAVAAANGADPRGDDIAIRGFSSGGRSQQYRDGLRHFLPAGYQGGISIEPYALERIEVLRGPSSILYGQGDPGGVINTVTKRPTDYQLRELQVQVGNHDRKQIAADFGGPLSDDGAWSYRLTGLLRDSDAHVDHVTDDRVFIAPALTWRPSAATSFTLLADYQKDRIGQGYQAWPRIGTLDDNSNGKIPTHRFLGEPGFDKHDVKRTSIGYLFEHAFDPVFTFRQNLRHTRHDTDSKTIYFAGLRADLRNARRFSEAGTEDVDGTVIDNQLQMKFRTGNVEHTASVGVDHQSFDGTIDYTFSTIADLDLFNPVYGSRPDSLDPDQERQSKLKQTGVYLQDQIKFGGKWVATLGGRKDWSKQADTNHLSNTRTSQKDSDLTWRAGLVYLADNGFAPYVSYAESFQPTMGSTFSGKAFEPETGQQYEVGVRYQPANRPIAIILSAFNISRQNITTTDPDHVGFSIQRGEVRSRGAELEIKAEIDRNLSAIVNYSHIDAEITKSNDGVQGNRPYNTPEHTASIWLDYKVPGNILPGLNVAGGIRYIGSTFGDDENTFRLPSYTLADLALRYDLSQLGWTGWSAALNVNNLFDKKYVARCNLYSDACRYGYRRSGALTVGYRW